MRVGRRKPLASPSLAQAQWLGALLEAAQSSKVEDRKSAFFEADEPQRLEAAQRHVHALPRYIGQQADLDLLQPTVLDNRLTERMLASPAHRRAYLDIIKRMTETSFSPAFVGRHVTLLRDVIAKAETTANVPHKPLPPSLPREFEPMVFLDARLKSVNGQLAGTHEGYLPYWQTGFFGVGKPPERRYHATTRPTTATTKSPAAPAGK